jgi:hypothetical protein
MTEKAGKAKEVLVPGAEYQKCSDLDDLTTAKAKKGRPYTNPTDWFGLHPKASEACNPTGVPGLQIDGYFPDDSKTTKEPGNDYGNRTFPHDSQFVIRFPVEWNGKLVITGPPGVRGQYANDFIIGDFVLAKGYAYAATDKGNSGNRFYSGEETRAASVADWHRCVEQLTVAAKEAAEGRYGKKPDRTYITGISNGGYLTRYALENTPDLYDGGVDWEGVLWLPDGPNLLDFLPPALRNFPNYYESGSLAAYGAMIKAGFEPGSEFLWPFYNTWYWGLVQRIFREPFDPTYPGAEAEYDYTSRPQEVKDAVKKVSLTGKVCKPLITLHGTLDALILMTKSSDVYAELIKREGRSDKHRYYRIEGGTHVDSLYDYLGPDPIKNPDNKLRDMFREKLRPILPCYRAAFDRLVDWVESNGEVRPPDSQIISKPAEGDVVNSCPTLEKQE